MATPAYEKFEPLRNAQLVLGYLTSMVDEKADNLPYWLVLPHKKPAEAAHCRVDDAELVGSWYEAIDAVRKMLKTEEGAEVQLSFYRHLMKSWGEHGLRFHEPYSWTHTNHSSFHEMGYILPALNRMVENNPLDPEPEKKASELVRGLRSLVIERKVRTFWSGDYEEKEPVYEFPNDVYLKDGGFDLSRHTGRGSREFAMRLCFTPWCADMRSPETGWRLIWLLALPTTSWDPRVILITKWSFSAISIRQAGLPPDSSVLDASQAPGGILPRVKGSMIISVPCPPPSAGYRNMPSGIRSMRSTVKPAALRI